MPTSPETAEGGQFIDLPEARLFYEEHGAGDPLLLLHGGFQSSVSWAGVVPLLATQFRVITPDSRGHGRSTNRAGQLTYQQLADDTVAVIAAVGLERPSIAGWSDGGQVALEIGLRHPDAARTLIVGGAFFDFGAGFQESLREIFGADDLGAINVGRVEAAFGEMGPSLRAMHPGGEDEWHELLRQTMHMWLEYPGLSELDFARIGTPTLVVVGDRDPFVSVEVATAMYRMLPAAQLAICPHADHDLPETHVTWFAQTVRDILGAQGTATT